jgi:O-methyltransferase
MDTPVDLYLELLKGCLTRSLFLEEEYREVRLGGWRACVWEAYKRTKRRSDWHIVAPADVDHRTRAEGWDWPNRAETMIGHRRLDNIQDCVTSVLADEVPGDLIEAGVWRGGAAILMRAVLAAHAVSDRSVWLADSFQGLPAPNAEMYPGDEGLDFTQYPELAVDVEQVKANFARYNLLDEKVRFLVGWFKDTLPVAPIDHVAVARLDGDLYESTLDSIAALYPKLSVGGYLIVDDYNTPGLSPACKQAIDDYRAVHGIIEPIEEVDTNGVYWRRER